MKARHPLHSGHLTNRINGLVSDIGVTIESISGLHDDNITLGEMKSWCKNRLFDIQTALREIDENYHKLVLEEASELWGNESEDG